MSKTKIIGTLRDSAGVPLTGKFIIKLTGDLPDTDYEPDSLLLPIPVESEINDGIVNLELSASETYKVTYNFQFYNLITASTNTDPAIYEELPSWELTSFVPSSTVPINIISLIQTGLSVSDIDTSIRLVTSSLERSETFNEKLNNLFTFKGTFNEDVIYKKNDLVIFNGRQWRYISNKQLAAQYPPTDNSDKNIYWVKWGGDKGEQGTGINGDDTAYDSTWNTNLAAPSKNVVYDKIETLATKAQLQSDYAPLNSPALTNIPTAPTPSTNDSSTRIATTAFVKAQNYLISSAAASVSSLTSTGIVTASQFRLSALNTTPASSTITTAVGNIFIDANYIYVATANNQLKRVALSTF